MLGFVSFKPERLAFGFAEPPQFPAKGMMIMITPDDIDALRLLAGEIARPINEYLIADICRRVAGVGAVTGTAEYQIYRAEALGMSRKGIADMVAKQMGISTQIIAQLMGKITERSMEFEDNGVLRQLTQAYANTTARAANGLLQNLWVPGPDGTLYTVADAYEKTMDFAFGKVFTGAADANTAIRQATQELARRGIRTIPRKKGGSVSIEYATRSFVINRMGELHGEIAQMNHDKLGATGWELSAHGACAEDHAFCQGRQYTDAEFEKMNDGLVRKIGTWQCRHIKYPVDVGKSKPNYTDAALQRMQEDNAKGVVYAGKHYTLYEAEQERASIESALRARRLQCIRSEALGDETKLQTDRIRNVRLAEEYTRFCKGTGQRTRSERIEVAGFGRGQAARAAASYRKYTNVPKCGILQDIQIELLPITMQSIQNVKAFSSTLLSLEQQRQLKNAHKRLLVQLSKEPLGTEGFSIFDFDMQKLQEGIGKQQGGFVQPPNMKTPHILTHTHPSGGSFTSSDLSAFCRRDNLKILTAVGNDGHVYAVEKMRNFDVIGFTRHLENCQSRHPNFKAEKKELDALFEEMLGGIEKYGVQYHR